MPSSVFPTFVRINRTPLRDLFRGRLSARLAWKQSLAGAGLPDDARELVVRVVMRTRLFRLEKSAVADELAAHFLDGLDSGATAAELVERFGDERAAARLIRRAKIRGRSGPWHLVRFVSRILGILLLVWGVFALRFVLGKPSRSVDYVAMAAGDPRGHYCESIGRTRLSPFPQFGG